MSMTKYIIINVDVENGTAEVEYKGLRAVITFHECGEVDVEGSGMSLEMLQEVHMMACGDEELFEVFPFGE